jgi:hypothetical protein
VGMCTGLHLYLGDTWFESDRFRGHGFSGSSVSPDQTESTFGDETWRFIDVTLHVAVPVPGRGGPQGSETSRLPHFSRQSARRWR